MLKEQTMNTRSIKPVKLFFIFLCSLFSVNIAQAQHAKADKESEKEALTKNLILSKNFTFKAQSVMPMRGGTRQLTSDYDLKVSGDSLIVYLPYFGRAFTAPINPGAGGIQFTSSDFEYKVEERRKGGWNINIVPKDNNSVREMLLTISKKGYATLQILSTNRDAISFNGYIAESKRHK
jgi:hypothetical protein